MEHINFENRAVPAIGLGTYLIKGKEAILIFEEAIEMGYHHLDTAQFYYNEAEIGTAVKNSSVDRDDLFITTKVWPTNLTKEKFIPSIEESLDKLQTDYVDLLLIHWHNPDLELEAYIHQLMEAQVQQKCRFIGVSNFNIDLLQKTLDFGAAIKCNQVEYHPLLNQQKLKMWQDKNHIPLTAYCPLAQGRMIKNPAILALANKHNKDSGQIVLRWMMQQNNIIAIPKSSNPKRLQSNKAIFDFELSTEDMTQINQLNNPSQRFVNNGKYSADWD